MSDSIGEVSCSWWANTVSLASLAEECPESWVALNSSGGMLEWELAELSDDVDGLAGVEVTWGPAVAMESFLESSGRAMTSDGMSPKC